MRRRFISALVIVAALTALGDVLPTTVALDATSQDAHEKKTLTGAWFFDITPTLVPAFKSLGTFSADGTLTNISSSSMGVPPESPGYGVWAQTGKNRFAITFGTLLGDGAGNFAGTAKVRSVVSLNGSGDVAEGVFQVDVFDASGALLVSDTGTVYGRRIALEVLP